MNKLGLAIAITAETFKKDYGKIMVAAQLRYSIEKQIKELCHS